MNVLIVDDDPQNREILRLRLQKAGYTVSEAADGAEGVRVAGESLPDLIVLDVMMPKMDGWQVCRKLRQDPKTQAIPVLMLTAMSRQMEELRGWESGADEYLTKPCDHEKLLGAVKRLLENKTSTAPSDPVRQTGATVGTDGTPGRCLAATPSSAAA